MFKAALSLINVSTNSCVEMADVPSTGPSLAHVACQLLVPLNILMRTSRHVVDNGRHQAGGVFFVLYDYHLSLIPYDLKSEGYHLFFSDSCVAVT